MKEKTNLEGTISINTKGVGFFDIVDPKSGDEESIEIQPKDVNRALHGDIVEISVTGEIIKN